MVSQAISKVSGDPDRFIRLGEDIWLVKGDESAQEIDKSQPTLVLLFGWMNAKPAHLAKFSAGYLRLYPNTPQIIVGSSGRIFISPRSSLISKMKPVLDHLVVLKVLGEHAEPHRILTQTFSNGGATRLSHLAQLLALPSNSKFTPVPNQPSLLIVDSAPGGDNMRAADISFRLTIPSPFIRYPFLAVIFLFHIIRYYLGKTHWLVWESLRLGILDARWLPWFTPTTASPSVPVTRYLFIYSKADRIVPFEDIQAFTERAENSGLLVSREVYTSPHVSHMRSDPSRYWAAVSRHWETAQGLEGSI